MKVASVALVAMVAVLLAVATATTYYYPETSKSLSRETLKSPRRILK